MRQEFTKPTMRQAWERSGERCEGLLSSGERCGAVLTRGKYHFDHIIPAALGGNNDLCNCAVLCIPCHKDKTERRDVPIIAKAKRVSDRHLGIRKKSQFPGSRDSKWKKKLDGSVIARSS